MKKIPVVSLFVLLAFVGLSCSLAGKFIDSGQDMNRVSDLWNDVPRIDGLSPSDMEPPLAVKLIMRTVLNNLWRFNKEDEDKTPASGDWVFFTLPGSPEDVSKFYTNERMTSFGNWQASQKTTCIDGKDKGINGVLCVFQKTVVKKDVGLAIIAMQDEKAKQTNLFFVRVEKPTENATNSSTGSKPVIAPDAPPKKGPITKLNGTAPYGIEKRPMPEGTDLDKLLPKQVGPYSRAGIEKSEQRGTPATSVQVDGSGVYATYKNGDKEVFVEFSIASSAENAQAGWDVVVGDANEGVYPKDPNFGSFGTEPSYLKVVNDSGAFFAWTRGGYFFSADAKSGEADLDAFMNAFPF